MSSYTNYKTRRENGHKRFPSMKPQKKHASTNTYYPRHNNYENRSKSENNFYGNKRRLSCENSYPAKRIRSTPNPWGGCSHFQNENTGLNNDSDGSVICLGSAHGSTVNLVSSEESLTGNKTKNTFGHSSLVQNKVNTENELERFKEILFKYKSDMQKVSNEPLTREDQQIIDEIITLEYQGSCQMAGPN